MSITNQLPSHLNVINMLSILSSLEGSTKIEFVRIILAVIAVVSALLVYASILLYRDRKMKLARIETIKELDDFVESIREIMSSPDYSEESIIAKQKALAEFLKKFTEAEKKATKEGDIFFAADIVIKFSIAEKALSTATIKQMMKMVQQI